MVDKIIKPGEMVKINYKPPEKPWMEPEVEFKKGKYCYSAPLKNQEILQLPNPRQWNPQDDDWKLPADFKPIILGGMKERLEKYRSWKLFLDICVRCGACADKCHYFIGSGDPKNMPVLRAELLRSVYRKYFTVGGKVFGELAGGRELAHIAAISVGREDRGGMLAWIQKALPGDPASGSVGRCGGGSTRLLPGC